MAYFGPPGGEAGRLVEPLVDERLALTELNDLPLSVNSRGLRWQCGRSFEVKNRPRANPVGGLGGGDRDAMATLDARYRPR
jgi:hypothetical protein